MRRGYQYQAWLEPGDEEIVRKEMARVREVYARALLTDEPLNYAYKELADLWTPIRQMLRTWVDSDRRKILSRRKRVNLDRENQQSLLEHGFYGSIWGRFISVMKDSPLYWHQIIKRIGSSRVRCDVELMASGEHPVYKFQMPLYTDKEKDRITIYFKMHRPVPENARIGFVNLGMAPRYGKHGELRGYQWSLTIQMEIPSPPSPGKVERSGKVEFSWEPQEDGRILVGFLAIQGQGEPINYYLPPGTIRRARKVLDEAHKLGFRSSEYWRYRRYLIDTYRKMAKDICNRVDILQMVPISRKRTKILKYKIYSQPSLFSQAVKSRAESSGLIFFEKK